MDPGRPRPAPPPHPRGAVPDLTAGPPRPPGPLAEALGTHATCSSILPGSAHAGRSILAASRFARTAPGGEAMAEKEKTKRGWGRREPRKPDPERERRIRERAEDFRNR